MAGIDEAERIRRRPFTLYWKQRSQRDFLCNMKFEFMQFCFFGSYLFNTIFVYPSKSKKQGLKEIEKLEIVSNVSDL